MEIPSYIGTALEHAWTLAVALGVFFFKRNDNRMAQIEQNHRDLEAALSQQTLNMVKNYTTRQELKDTVEHLSRAQQASIEHLAQQIEDYREDFKMVAERFLDHITKN